MKSASVRISYKPQFKAGPQKIKSALEELDSDTTKYLNKLFQDVFGPGERFSDWEGSKAKAQNEKLQKFLQTGYTSNSKSAKRLRMLYVDAWKKKYKKIRDAYASADSGYTDREWHEWKKRGRRKYRTPHYPARQVEYTTWALTSGYLRDSIASAFRSPQSEVFVGNLLLQGGYQVNWEYYPQSNGQAHYQWFIELLIDKGVVSSEEDFINFLPSDWRKIANQMAKIAQQEFVGEMQGAIDKVDVEV